MAKHAAPADGGLDDDVDAQAADVESGKAETGDGASGADTAAGDTAEDAPKKPEEPRKPWSLIRLATVVGIVVVLALAALTGWLGEQAWQAHQAEQDRERFVDAGRQGALNLTSVDWERADADVQRILDSATGKFYDQFEQRAAPYAEVVKQAKSKSAGTVQQAGLESVSDAGDEAKVLVAVSIATSNAGAPDQPLRFWRMRMTVQDVGDQMKVSEVEFVQ